MIKMTDEIEMTPLDHAHAAMDAAPEDDTARLRFFERLADGELILLLAREADGDRIEPETFDVDGQSFVVAFDSEARLATFVGAPAPYAALSGRIAARMLATQGLGLALNPEVAPSSMLLEPAALTWLDETLGHAPDQVEAGIRDIRSPSGLPEALLTALGSKLATAAGLAEVAYLVGVTFANGGKGHMLGIVNAAPGAEAALAKAINEALTFSGIEAGTLDVAFFAGSDPLADPASGPLSRHGLRFDVPSPPKAPTHTPTMPGSDPAKPPKLR